MGWFWDKLSKKIICPKLSLGAGAAGNAGNT